jgi:tRNA (cytidine/uridine-2'-O-)-methyltransferase
MSGVYDVVLVHPQIAPNTGNIMRLCANTGSPLHLVRPLGFSLSDRLLARAGLDYRDQASVTVHNSWSDLQGALRDRRWFVVDTSGDQHHTDVRFAVGDVLVFGGEPAGLPQEILAAFPRQRRLRIPMVPTSRSLNLSNAVAVVVYEAWRQQGFASGD